MRIFSISRTIRNRVRLIFCASLSSEKCERFECPAFETQQLLRHRRSDRICRCVRINDGMYRFDLTRLSPCAGRRYALEVRGQYDFVPRRLVSLPSRRCHWSSTIILSIARLMNSLCDSVLSECLPPTRVQLYRSLLC